MRYALVGNERRLPERNTVGECESCLMPVIPKCGEINIWHWAHMANMSCNDTWHEPITKWHLNWQDQVPKKNQEVVIKKEINDKTIVHRADILTNNDTVVEVQNSPISTKIIAEREEFYGENMIWIFNVFDAFMERRIGFYLSRHVWENKEYTNAIMPNLRLDWTHRKRSIWASKRKVFLDTGTEFLLLKAPEDVFHPCPIKIVRREDLIKALNGKTLQIPEQRVNLLVELDSAYKKLEEDYDWD